MTVWRVALAAACVVLVLAVLYSFAVGAFSRPRTPAWLTAQPYAHRGYHFEVLHPENSLPSFASAAAAGYGVELDVHLTSDGHTVVIHDDSLARTTGDPRQVETTTLAELRELRLQGTPERIPTLAEALNAVGGRTPVLVEIKNRGDAGALEARVVQEIRSYKGPAAIISFNPLSLEGVAALAPEIPRGQISGQLEDADLPAWQVFVLKHLLANFKSKPDFIVYDLDAVPSWDTSLQRLLGRRLLVYAPATEADAERARELADGFIGSPDSLRRP